MSELSDGAPKHVAETHTASRFLDAERDKGRQLSDLLREMDVLIITLGSVETWRDTETGHVLKAPMLLSEYSPQRHQFEVEGFADTLGHLETVDRVAKALFPHLKIIFTLPLGRMATFRPLSALNAACAQEATLRAALFEFLEERAGDSRLHYYPGYELFNQFFTDPFSADNSHATPYVTGRLCAGFADMFCSAAPQAPAEGSLKGYDPFFTQAVAASLHDHEMSVGDTEAQSKIAILEEENQMLKRVCDERLTVIEKLDRAVKSLQ